MKTIDHGGGQVRWVLGPYPTKGRPSEWRSGIGPDAGLVTSLPAISLAGVLVGEAEKCLQVPGVEPWNLHPQNPGPTWLPLPVFTSSS